MAAPVRADDAAMGAIRERTFSRRDSLSLPRPEACSPSGGGKPIFAAVDRLSGEGGERLYPSILVFRLSSQPFLPHNHHHTSIEPARLPARTRHLPRCRRSRAHAYRPCVYGSSGAIRRRGPHAAATRTLYSRLHPAPEPPGPH